MSASADPQLLVPSRGWRRIWVFRAGFLAISVMLIFFSAALLGWPWLTSAPDLPLGASLAFVLGLELLLESQAPRWISLDSSGVTFAYLTSKTRVAWGALAPYKIPLGSNMFGYRDKQAAGFGTRVHMLTKEQSEAVLRYSPPGWSALSQS